MVAASTDTTRANFLKVVNYLVSVVQPALTWIYECDCNDKYPTESLHNYLVRTNHPRLHKDSLRVFAQSHFKVLDVSALFMYFRRVGRKTSRNASDWENPTTLEGKLKILKDMRNNLYHGPSELSVYSMELYLEKFQTITMEALEESVRRYDKTNEDFEQITRRIENYSEKILEYREDLTHSRHTLEHIFMSVIRDGCDELKQCCDRWSCINPLSFLAGYNVLVEVDAIFTELSVYNGGRIKRDMTQVSVSDILFSLDSNVVLIEGQSGAGKSTLLKYIISRWNKRFAENNKDLIDFDVVLLLECRRCIESLEHYLRSILSKTLTDFPNINIVQCITSLNVLFLIDGLDELTPPTENVVSQIMLEAQKPNVCVICTSRPTSIEDAYKLMPELTNVRHIRLDGVPLSKFEKFITRVSLSLRKEGELVEDFSVRIPNLLRCLTTSANNIRDLFKFPLNLTLITFIFLLKTPEETILELTSATQIYIKFVDFITEKVCARLKNIQLCKIHKTNVLREAVQKVYRVICKHALHHIRKNETMLTEDALKDIRMSCNSIECESIIVAIPHEEITAAFLSVSHSWDGYSYSVKQHRFHHLYFQEYMAAEALCLKLIGIAFRLLNANRNWIHVSLPKIFVHQLILKYLDKKNVSLNILLNVCGLLHEKYQDKLCQLLEPLSNFAKQRYYPAHHWWFDLLRETANDDRVSKIIASYVPKDEWFIPDFAVKQASSLLKYTFPKSAHMVSYRHSSLLEWTQLVETISQLKCQIRFHLHHGVDSLHPFTHERLLSTLSNGNVEIVQFYGNLSSVESIGYLPSTLTSLKLKIVDLDILKKLLDWDHLSKLRSLELWIKAGCSLRQDLCPLPRGPNCSCCISGVTDSLVEWTISLVNILLSDVNEEPIRESANRLLPFQSKISMKISCDLSSSSSINLLASAMDPLHLVIASPRTLIFLRNSTATLKIKTLSVDIEAGIIPLSSMKPFHDGLCINLLFFNMTDRLVDWAYQAALLMQPSNGFECVQLMDKLDLTLLTVDHRLQMKGVEESLTIAGRERFMKHLLPDKKESIMQPMRGSSMTRSTKGIGRPRARSTKTDPTLIRVKVPMKKLEMHLETSPRSLNTVGGAEMNAGGMV